MPALLTPCVCLRPLLFGDAPVLRALAAGEGVAGLPPNPSLAECRRFIRTAHACRASRQAFHFAVEERPAPGGTRRFFGWTGLVQVDWASRSAEAGTWIVPRWRGRAVNVAAKRLLLDHAFSELGLMQVRFLAALENGRSIRALEKLGARREGLIDGFPDGSVEFSIWRDDDQVI